ncbi:AMP-binding protein [Raoultibacter phocaeensis]|uniref:AMP-binding protein n=1 Tax=Raoultibacter phocaeensis TaxID=2479841 RepID=UPI00111A2E8D|nr:AMP-binding protein [Raoultibacter phocaeensis]
MALNSREYGQDKVWGNRVALVDEEKTITFSQLCSAADSVTEGLKSRTVVLFIASNTVACVVGYVAFMRKGIVPLMVSSSIGEDELNALLEMYEPEYVWHKDIDGFPGRTAAVYGDYRLTETAYESASEINSDLALLLTTSGSTGTQKYVRLTYENVKSNASAIAEYLSITEDDRAITTLPLSYSYGLSIINSHLISGASIILTERTLFDRGLWNLLKEKEATSFGGVPYTYEMLKRLHFERMDIPSLRYITQAGGRLSEELQHEFAEICMSKGIEFFVMYGQTEATARLTYLPAEYASEKIGSIGVPIPGGEIMLADEEGNAISEANKAGELVYKGSNVSLGYATCRADLGLGDERHGWLKTGDVAMRDEDGFYRIVGRKKRFLKLYGNRVNLDDVEAILSKEGYVAACAGRDDSMSVYVEGDQENAKAAQVFLANKLGLYKGAFKVRPITALPRNEAGKLLYAELEATKNA